MARDLSHVQPDNKYILTNPFKEIEMHQRNVKYSSLVHIGAAFERMTNDNSKMHEANSDFLK
jgi:hypothetical protein